MLGQIRARVAAAASTNATLLKASSGAISSIVLMNTSAAQKFVKFYDLAVAPTVGTSTVAFTVIVPIAAAGPINVTFPRGLRFATGIAYAITNLVADSDTTAVTANDVHGVIAYL